jgi:hypothetical protein
MRKLLLPGLGIAAAIALSGCDSNHKSGSAASEQTSTVCGTYSGKGCASANKRVDLAVPSFSHSTEITNALFPIGHGRSAVLLGHVDGKPFRTETTVLPGRQTVDWNGRRIPVLISQYMAYLDGRLDEVAIDRYAQADDGSVWYLGEDVFDYRKGAIAITEGTWLAGREGPAAMIMPAHPKLGDVFRPENAIGIVFEEVTVTSVGKTVAGPRGPVAGAILTKELHSDRTTEDKLFAPDYGEFRTSGAGDLEALALELPTDALPGEPPTELESLSKGANGLLELSRIKEWLAADATIRGMNADWATLQAGNPPPLIADRLTKSLAALTDAVKARKAVQTAQKAIDVSQSVLDLELRHRAQSTIDAQRFYLWTQQLRVDAADEDLAGITGDIAVLEWIRDRITERLGPTGREDIDLRLRALRGATDAKNLPAAADHAARLGARIRAFTRA